MLGISKDNLVKGSLLSSLLYSEVQRDKNKALFRIGYTCDTNFLFCSKDFSLKNASRVKAFGVHLRRLREDSGLSQQGLADAADIAKITIQRIENAKYATTLDMLLTISKALKIPLSELVDF